MNNQGNNQNGTNNQRRGLTNEERRRLEEARRSTPGTERQPSGAPETQRQSHPVQQETQRQSRPVQQDRNRMPENKPKKKTRVNIGAIIFVVLIIAVIFFSVKQLIGDSGWRFPSRETDKPVESESPETQPDVTKEDDVTPSAVAYKTVSIDNSKIDEGNLILVNYSHKYNDVDTVQLESVYERLRGKAKLSGTGLLMKKDAIDAAEQLLADMLEETGCDDLLFTSCYRTIDDQQRIYSKNVEESGEEYARAYVALPGYSEHHTGLATDLAFLSDEGYTISIAEHEFGEWLTNNCTKYGFILRYPADKIDITMIAYESWHFRYVGIPHAIACTHFGYCFEEYIGELKNYKAGEKMLHITEGGIVETVSADSMPKTGWLIYSVPMSTSETTDIEIPDGEAYSDYEISGNNAGSFIITIKLK